MTTRDTITIQLHTLLEDLAQWENEIPAHYLTTISLHAINYQLAPANAKNPQASPVTQALEQQQQITDTLELIRTAAADHGYQPDQHGSPSLYLLSQLHNARHYPLWQLRQTLQTITKAHQQATTTTSHQINRICPHHPETLTLLQAAPNNKHYCPHCHASMTSQELDATTLTALLEANPLVPIPLAARLLNIEPKTIRQWTRRDRIDSNNGQVWLTETWQQKQDTPTI